MNRIALASALMLGLFTATVAKAESFEVDPVHTAVVFKIGHMQISHTYGMFRDVSGTIEFDAEKPESNSVHIVIKTESIDTDNEMRDNHLRNEDFLHVEEYPEMSFKSKSWKSTGDKTYDVTGDFTLHGVTKEITVPVTYLGSADDPRGNHRAGFETKFTIKRSEYVMDKMIPGAGDEVEITISSEGIRK